MDESKKRERKIKKKAYRIICKIDRIEEIELGSENEDVDVVLETTDTINVIDGDCQLEMTNGKTKISLGDVENVMIVPDKKLRMTVREMKGGSSINIF